MALRATRRVCGGGEIRKLGGTRFFGFAGFDCGSEWEPGDGCGHIENGDGPDCERQKAICGDESPAGDTYGIPGARALLEEIRLCRAPQRCEGQRFLDY